MRNNYQIKHPRGSTPPPTQSEQDLDGNARGSTSIEQNPDNSGTNTPGKLTVLESHPCNEPDDDGRWQDDGGEGG
jgi:hypothetical protein